MSLARIADFTYSLNEYIAKYTMRGTQYGEPFLADSKRYGIGSISILACNLLLAVPNFFILPYILLF